MTIENQVSNLELSRKLKELKVKQESVWYWMKMKRPDVWQLACKNMIGFTFENGAGVANHRIDEFEMVSAFTVAELGEMLPRNILVKKVPHWLQFEIRDSQGGWSCQYRSIGSDTLKFFEDKTMADCGAKMLIHLIENKLIKV